MTCYTEENHKDYPVKPVAFTDVRVNDSFWKSRMVTNRMVTIPYAFKKCEEYGRMDNFAIAGGLKEGEHRGKYPFDDTDVYKIIEGASFSLSRFPDPDLETYLDHVISLIAAAQEDDGYLFTPITTGSKALHHRVGDTRWDMIPKYSHELYNCGHLYEAAVAHYQATGKRTLLDVACRNADLIDRIFGPGKNETAPGHQIIEMGLAKLYRVTGEQRYLDLAKFFLDTRGPDGSEYSQEHKKVLEQNEAVGHAVRAGYMYSGMADVAALTGCNEYIEAIDRLWDNVVTKKLYITGGFGSRHHGESFGENYELPNGSAYNETCAAISNVYWNHRLFLLHGDAKYIDLMERTLYNGFLSGIGLSGTRFSYPNALESYGQHKRSPWFGCSCCPGNVTRFLASVAGYAYAKQGDDMYVNLFISGETTIQLDSAKVAVRQETRYPWDGKVVMTVVPETPAEFSLKIRIPGWTQNRPVPSDLYRFMQERDETVSLSVNGEDYPLEIKNGYVTIKRAWQPGDTVELDMPMPLRRVLCDENVEENRGKVALSRGPVVFCIEWLDVDDEHVLNLLLPDDMQLHTEFRADMLNGIQVITGNALAYMKDSVTGECTSEVVNFTAIPYYAWEHRGAGEMAVWLAREEYAVRPKLVNTISENSKVEFSNGINPEHRYYHWQPRNGHAEWIQYTFDNSKKVSEVEVYWFDDTDNRDRDFPLGWQVLYRKDEEWIPVSTTDEFGIERDMYNRIQFEPVETDALRLKISMPPVSGGIIDWQVR
jgi:DUF1680 family protein